MQKYKKLEPMESDKPYKKLTECHYKLGKGLICGSTDLCDHPGWPTLCKRHCKEM